MKEIKRLTELSNCTHLSKTDRDALKWVLHQVAPEEVAPDKGFDGWNFETWPSIPNEAAFSELIKARKSKHKVIMTQAYIDSAAPHLQELARHGVSVSESVRMATNNGWQGFRAKWVLNSLEEDKNPQVLEIRTVQDAWQQIKSGAITKASELPSPIRSELETMMRTGKFAKPESIELLNRVGLLI